MPREIAIKRFQERFGKVFSHKILVWSLISVVLMTYHLENF